MNKWTWPSTVGALALGFGLGWSLHPSEAPARSREWIALPPPASTTRAEPALELSAPSRSPIVLGTSTEATEPRPEVRTELSVAEAMAALDRALAAAPRAVPEPGSFAEKYQGASLEALHAARDLLRVQLDAETKRIVDERMRAGLYDEYSESEGAVTTDGDPIRSVGFAQVIGPDGSISTRSTGIPPDEYPDFQRRQLEWLWLYQKVRGQPLASTTTSNW